LSSPPWRVNLHHAVLMGLAVRCSAVDSHWRASTLRPSTKLARPPVAILPGAFLRVQRMMQPRRKPTNSLRNRALEIIAAHPNGCTEAMLAAHDIPADVLVELVQSGLVLARMERVDEEDGFFEVTTLWISAAGELVLAARW
jgi:hypothetical protein